MVELSLEGLHSFLIVLQSIHVLVLTQDLSDIAAVLDGVLGLQSQLGEILHQALLVRLVLLSDLQDPVLHGSQSLRIIFVVRRVQEFFDCFNVMYIEDTVKFSIA